MDLDLRLLRYFAAVGEHEHVGRAAEQLFISQPALSKQIRRFEATLGVELINRVGRRIELTPAGRTLLEAAPDLLANAAEVLQRTVESGRGATGDVRVAFVPGAARIAADVLRRAEASLPGVAVTLHRVDWTASTSCLTDGTTDLCLLRPPIDAPGTEQRILLSEPRVAGFASNHRFAGRDSISINELSDEPVIDTTAQRDYWAVDPRPDGTTPAADHWPTPSRTCSPSSPPAAACASPPPP